jgi:hypothetical protein
VIGHGDARSGKIALGLVPGAQEVRRPGSGDDPQGWLHCRSTYPGGSHAALRPTPSALARRRCRARHPAHDHHGPDARDRRRDPLRVPASPAFVCADQGGNTLRHPLGQDLRAHGAGRDAGCQLRGPRGRAGDQRFHRGHRQQQRHQLWRGQLADGGPHGQAGSAGLQRSTWIDRRMRTPGVPGVSRARAWATLRTCRHCGWPQPAQPDQFPHRLLARPA